MPIASWETVTGQENLLVLAAEPGDETRHCGGLIATSCRRGRPPFVLVLTDRRSAADRSREAGTRAAMRALGLPANRMLMAGLFAGTLPGEGAAFDAIVSGIATIMWARDCNVICAPPPDGTAGDAAAAHRIAVAVAQRTGVRRLFYAGGPGAMCLDIAPALAAKQQAIAAHALHVPDAARFERFT